MITVPLALVEGIPRILKAPAQVVIVTVSYLQSALSESYLSLQSQRQLARAGRSKLTPRMNSAAGRLICAGNPWSDCGETIYFTGGLLLVALSATPFSGSNLRTIQRL